jgi:hypothetical protein
MLLLENVKCSGRHPFAKNFTSQRIEHEQEHVHEHEETTHHKIGRLGDATLPMRPDLESTELSGLARAGSNKGIADFGFRNWQSC